MHWGDWNAISALANVVMALTAIVAALYALKQYRHSVHLQELQQMLEMYRYADALLHRLVTEVTENGQERPTEHQARSVLNMLSVHERLISDRLFSSRVEQFYREMITIGPHVDMNNPFSQVIKEILRNNQEEFRHLIVSLRAHPDTSPLTEW
ncbi:hypothetical protein [Sinorhizobium meliloti]|uniref:hypothetical protein n=1 Tax=Rhizobium meliloti TaxID=382 RepID=UPI00209054C4|nr:hypothetical protein [Sinorhizobium meliloti]MCO5962355.1 hypothetical protein [Sinorhizobium meliloti]